MKKILFVMDSLENNGAVKALVSLLHALDYKKNKVDLFVLNQDLSFFRNQIPKEVTVLESEEYVQEFFRPTLHAVKWYCKNGYLRAAIWKVVYFIISKMSIIKALQIVWPKISAHSQKINKEYDYVVAYNDFTPWCFAVDNVFAKEYIGWNHNIYEDMGYDDSRYYKQLKRLDKIVTISELCKISLTKHFRIDSNKLFVINNIVDIDEIQSRAIEPMIFEYPRTGISILSIGRLTTQKGYDMFIQSLANLQTDSEWYFYIIGEGPDKEKFQKLIYDNCLETKVFMLGAKTNPYPYIVNCDVYVQPSKYEGYGIALDEALVLHKPILATNTVKERFCDGKNAILLEYDVQVWTNALKKIIENKKLRELLTEGTYCYRENNGLDQFYHMLEV